MVQEMIPGGGEAQFSYTALCREGKPVASVTARRTRQYPIDFGHSSCLVETIAVPEIEEPARRLLAAIRYSGLIEVEFKYDRRDGRYKVLDMNPRLWTWAALCQPAGVDYPFLLWQMLRGEMVSNVSGQPGYRWIRLSTDVPAAIQEMWSGRLDLMGYLRSLRSPRMFAVVAADDLLPGLLDLPLTAISQWKRALHRLRGRRAVIDGQSQSNPAIHT
jgi:predicted ATP-grasp superfamily ATP-dependent carboligase